MARIRQQEGLHGGSAGGLSAAVQHLLPAPAPEGSLNDSGRMHCLAVLSLRHCLRHLSTPLVDKNPCSLINLSPYQLEFLSLQWCYMCGLVDLFAPPVSTCTIQPLRELEGQCTGTACPVFAFSATSAWQTVPQPVSTPAIQELGEIPYGLSSKGMRRDPSYSVDKRTCISSLTLQQCGSSRQVTSAVGSRTNAAKLRRSTRVSDSPSPPAAYATRSPDQVAAKPLCSRRRAVSACQKRMSIQLLQFQDLQTTLFLAGSRMRLQMAA